MYGLQRQGSSLGVLYQMADVKCTANYCSTAELPFEIQCSLIEKDLVLLFGPFQSDSV